VGEDDTLENDLPSWIAFNCVEPHHVALLNLELTAICFDNCIHRMNSTGEPT
jgi:hypothetical protein